MQVLTEEVLHSWYETSRVCGQTSNIDATDSCRFVPAFLLSLFSFFLFSFYSISKEQIKSQACTNWHCGLTPRPACSEIPAVCSQIPSCGWTSARTGTSSTTPTATTSGTTAARASLGSSHVCTPRSGFPRSSRGRSPPIIPVSWPSFFAGFPRVCALSIRTSARKCFLLLHPSPKLRPTQFYPVRN